MEGTHSISFLNLHETLLCYHKENMAHCSYFQLKAHLEIPFVVEMYVHNFEPVFSDISLYKGSNSCQIQELKGQIISHQIISLHQNSHTPHRWSWTPLKHHFGSMQCPRCPRASFFFVHNIQKAHLMHTYSFVSTQSENRK